MKYVFSSPDPAQVGLVQSLLDAEGVAFELRNEAVSQVEVGMPFITEIWVLRDKDHEKAVELIQSIGVKS